MPKTSVAAPSVAYEPWLIEQLRDPAEAAAHLKTVVEEGDQAALALALPPIESAQRA